jgi:hypothetical protein
MSQLIRPWSLIQQSQIGHGTTMNLFLPLARDVVVKAAEPVPETISRRHGTILVADDEDVVRTLTTRLTTSSSTARSECSQNRSRKTISSRVSM